MVRLSRILRDYREAGGVNTLLALWGFVDEAHVPDEGRPRRPRRTGSAASTPKA